MLDKGFELHVKRMESGSIGFEAFGPVVFGGCGKPDDVVRSVVCLCEGSGDDASRRYFRQVMCGLVAELRGDLSQEVLSLVGEGA